MAMAVDRGWLNYTDKISQHWPEFASGGQEGKKEVRIWNTNCSIVTIKLLFQLTIADVLRHEGGMPVFSEQMNIEDCYPENFSNNGVGEIIERQTLKYPSGMK